MVQFSHPYMTIGKAIALTIWTFVGKVMSLLFNRLSRRLNFPSEEQVAFNFMASNKCPCSQSYGFTNCYVWIWELEHEEGWVSKNWCFWIMMLGKTLESPLDCKKIKPVNPKGNQPWIFTGRTLKLGKIENGGVFYRKFSLLSQVEVKWKSLSHVRLFVTPWTIQSMEFSRPEYWSG